MRCAPRALAGGLRLLLRAAAALGARAAAVALARRLLVAAHTGWVCAVLAARLLSLTRRHSCRWALFAARLVAFAVLCAPPVAALGAWYALSRRVARAVRWGPHRRNDADVVAPRAGVAFCVCPERDSRACACDPARRPVVVCFAGGAWTIGHRLWALATARGLSAAGCVAVCTDYRNFPQTVMGGMLSDVDAVLECLLGGAVAGGTAPPSHDEHQQQPAGGEPRVADDGRALRAAVLAAGGDLSRVFIWGHSAGAHLAVATVLERAICATLAVHLAAAPHSSQLTASVAPRARPTSPAAATPGSQLRPRAASAFRLLPAEAPGYTPPPSASPAGPRVRLAPTPPTARHRHSLSSVSRLDGDAALARKNEELDAALAREDEELDSELGSLGRLAMAATADVAPLASPRGWRASSLVPLWGPGFSPHPCTLPSSHRAPQLLSPPVIHAARQKDKAGCEGATGGSEHATSPPASRVWALAPSAAPNRAATPVLLAMPAAVTTASPPLPVAPAGASTRSSFAPAPPVSSALLVYPACGSVTYAAWLPVAGDGDSPPAPAPPPRLARLPVRVFGISGPYCLEQQAAAIALKAGFLPAFFDTAFEGQARRFSPPWWLRQCVDAHHALPTVRHGAGGSPQAAASPLHLDGSSAGGRSRVAVASGVSARGASAAASSATTARVAGPAFPPLDPRHLPPFSLYHGTADSTVPHASSVALHAALLGAAAASRLTLLPGGGHTTAVLEDPLGGTDALLALILADMRADLMAGGEGGVGAASSADVAASPPMPPCDAPQPTPHVRPLLLPRHGAPPLLGPAVFLRVARWINPF